MEVTIPEGSTGSIVGEERSKTPSRLRSSSLDSRFSGFSSNGQHDSNNNNGGGSGSGGTPSSTCSTLSIPMPITRKDIFNPAAPPMMSSTRGMNNE